MLTFAIVIPNYNQSHFLPWALESLRHQSVPLNVALMDGGSTDDFREVVADYSDMITCLNSGPDGGQAAAIRKGMEMVPGEIVTWLNADDYYFPHILNKVSALFENDPALDVIYGNAVHVTKEGYFLSYFPAIQEFNAKDLTRSCFICQPACFVRRTAYESSGGLNPTLKYTMDWDLWCRLARNGSKFKYIPDLLAAVRYYPETKTMSGDGHRYGEIWRIEKRYGHRLIPSSWPGFYRFDLAFKKNRNLFEKAVLKGLDQLRKCKRLVRYRRFGSVSNDLLYGFVRWEAVAKGQCTIYVPWYEKRQWKRLNFRVEPDNAIYRVRIDNEKLQTVRAQKGVLSIKVFCSPGPLKRISMSCPGSPVWKLLTFSCDFS